jgi:hypothetical protein
MAQQSGSGPKPTLAAQSAAQGARRGDPTQTAPKMPSEQDWQKLVPRDSDPAAKEAMQAMFKASFLEPGTGLGTPVTSPETGIRREQRRRMAQGASAQERMKMFKEAGVTDTAGMARVFNRAYTTPERAFMMGKGR